VAKSKVPGGRGWKTQRKKGRRKSLISRWRKTESRNNCACAAGGIFCKGKRELMRSKGAGNTTVHAVFGFRRRTEGEKRKGKQEEHTKDKEKQISMTRIGGEDQAEPISTMNSS